jgi:hypothetical protein
MPATTPTQFRLTDAERARLDELGRLYGTPGRPLSWAEVFRRLIWHQCPADTRPANPPVPARRPGPAPARP